MANAMQCKTEDRATIMTLLGNLIINLMANCVGCYQVSNLCHLPWCEAANINHNIQGKTIMLGRSRSRILGIFDNS